MNCILFLSNFFSQGTNLKVDSRNKIYASRAVPTRIVLLNRIVHLNTVNRIVRNWTITPFKIWHSPDFQKPGCGERAIWFDPYCPFKKKKKSKEVNLVGTAFYFSKLLIISYPDTIHFKSYSPFKYFIHVSTKSSSLFSIFVTSCIFSLFRPF